MPPLSLPLDSSLSSISNTHEVRQGCIRDAMQKKEVHSGNAPVLVSVVHVLCESLNVDRAS